MSEIAVSSAWTAYVEDVRAKIQVPDAAASYIEPLARQWSRSGRGQYKCLSPLRQEKTPSFYVYEDGGWFDFGTSEGGDLIGFVEKHKSCSFKEALDELARFFSVIPWDERAKGLNGASPSPEELLRLWHDHGKSRRVFEVLTALVHLCHDELPEKAREHLRDHYGLEDWFIDFEKVGYCPPGLWVLAKESMPNVSDAELLSTGMFHQLKFASKDPTPVLSGRIVFSYWKDSTCRYVIGREWNGPVPSDQVAVEEYDQGKYKKLPTHDSIKWPFVSETIQNNVFWGEDCLRDVRGKTVCVTEGVTDAMMLRQLGYAVISPVTVRFRNDDIARACVLLASAKEVIILNDEEDNSAGLEGAKKMAAELWKAKLRARIGRLPRPEGVAKTDVNEVGRNALREGGENKAKDVFDKLFAEALPYPEFILSLVGPDLAPNQTSDLIEDLAALTINASAVERDALVDRICKSIKVRKASVRDVFERSAKDHKKEKQERARAEAIGEGVTGPGYLRGTVTDSLGYYEAVNPSGETEGISNFNLVPLKTVQRQFGKPAWVVCRVDDMNGKTLRDEWSIDPDTWKRTTEFKVHLPEITMSWMGSDDNVQGLKHLLTRGIEKIPRVAGVEQMGRHETADGSRRFVLPYGSLSPEGWVENSDIVLLQSDTSLLKHLPGTRPDLEEGKSVVATVWPKLLELHERESMAIIVGWWMASLFRPLLHEELGAFPILNVYASPQAGKTSLFSHVFWPVFAGVRNGDPLSCAATTAAYKVDLSSSNAIGIVLDEYKPSDIQAKPLDALHRGLRKVYTGETEVRGRPGGGVDVFWYRTPVAILGESRIDVDQALAERCLYVNLKGTWIPNHPDDQKRFEAIRGLQLWKAAPWLQCWSLRAFFDSIFIDASSKVDEGLETLKRTVSNRARIALVACIFGLLAFEAVAEEVGVKDKTPAVDAKVIIVRVLREMFEEEESSGSISHVRDNFDNFIVDASVLANANQIEERRHYAWVREKSRDVLCLWIPGIEAVRNEWKKRQGSPISSPGPRALTHLAKEKLEQTDSYVVEIGRAVLMKDGRVRCAAIDASKIPESLKAEEFPKDFVVSHGGNQYVRTHEDKNNVVDMWQKMSHEAPKVIS